MPQHYCDDCGKEILTPEDEISYFNNDRCQVCEAQMFRYMADQAETERLDKENK